MNKPISNLRKLKHIEKAAQRDWAHRHEIRAAGLRALGFYSEPFLYPWFNPVGNLYRMLLLVKPKRRAAIFRLGRAAMKKGLLIKIQSLGTPNWLDLKKMDSSVDFVSEFKCGDLRKLTFSTPEKDKLHDSVESIKQFIYEKVNHMEPDDKWEVLAEVRDWLN